MKDIGLFFKYLGNLFGFHRSGDDFGRDHILAGRRRREARSLVVTSAHRGLQEDGGNRWKAASTACRCLVGPFVTCSARDTGVGTCLHGEPRGRHSQGPRVALRGVVPRRCGARGGRPPRGARLRAAGSSSCRSPSPTGARRGLRRGASDATGRPFRRERTGGGLGTPARKRFRGPFSACPQRRQSQGLGVRGVVVLGARLGKRSKVRMCAPAEIAGANLQRGWPS